MLLSVVVYNHTLTPGQWLGAGVVFAGISVEAWVKRKGGKLSAPHCGAKDTFLMTVLLWQMYMRSA